MMPIAFILCVVAGIKAGPKTVEMAYIWGLSLSADASGHAINPTAIGATAWAMSYADVLRLTDQQSKSCNEAPLEVFCC